MNILLAVLSGLLTAGMIVLNGGLSELYGNYKSTVLIHFVGLITIIIVLLITRSKVKNLKGIPIYLFSAGAIGVLTVYFNNISFSILGVSIPLALGLLGQTITSMVIDQAGLFGMQRISFNKKKCFGLLLIIIGIVIMYLF